MFNDLSLKLENVFKKLSGRGVINEKNIRDALSEVRVALLDADVHFQVVKEFIDDDELVEITPLNFRVRKKILKEADRRRDERKKRD